MAAEDTTPCTCEPEYAERELVSPRCPRDDPNGHERDKYFDRFGKRLPPPSAPPSAPHGDGGGVVRPQGDQLIGAEGASPMKPAPCPKDCPFCLGTNYVATSLRGTTLAAYKADASNSHPCPAGQVRALEAELARMTRLADNHYALVRATSDELTQERERANTAEQFWREYAKSTAIFSARAEAAETEVARLQEALRQLWDENPEITFEEAK